jgi:hypothetical protein
MFLDQLRTTHLAAPQLLALALLIPAALVLFRWRPAKLRLPRVRMVKAINPRRHMRLAPAALFSSGLFMLVVAATGPYVPFAESEKTRVGCAITVALDISKSMLWAQDKDHAEPSRGQPDRFRLGTKLIHTLAKYCEENSPGDIIQVIVFDESARVAITFTGDFKQIYRKADLLSLTRGLDDDLDGGTNFGGKGPGPIDLAAEEFDAFLVPLDARFMVVVTDGDDKLDPSPDQTPNRDRLLHLLRKSGIRMDVVGAGPALGAGAADIVALSKSAGGSLFTLGGQDQSAAFLASVKALKRVSLAGDRVFERIQLYRIFAALGAALILGWLWSEARTFNC